MSELTDKFSSPSISVVIPTYKCAECLRELTRRLQASLEKLAVSFEIIFVNDCSPQNDWQIIQELAKGDSCVRGINFSRNFGQHHAITAGVDVARADWVVVMDGDLQDQPEEIHRLFDHATRGGFDIVFARKVQRKDGWSKVFFSRMYSRLFNLLCEKHLEHHGSHFSIASRKAITAYRQLREQSRSYALGLLWCGFSVGYLDVEHATRFAGSTSYSFRRGFNLAIESISSHSNKPLHFMMGVGFIIAFLSFLFGISIIVRYYLYGFGVIGWASLMTSLYFLFGLLMVNMGIIGIYIGKVFDQTKSRPLYIIRDKINFDPPT
ncbi:MAG: glycosyltransferase family 2 protein [Candidatus Riflebacteria bacterium]|nr:glycosyltransferase family 2 protein [Candidatus Riflebacteria bacterium]